MVQAIIEKPTIRRYVGRYTQPGAFIERTEPNVYMYCGPNGRKIWLDVTDAERDAWVLTNHWRDITDG